MSSTQVAFFNTEQYVSLIGQDPSNTTILWAGSSGGTMLYLNGVAYSRFDRLTFNGQGNVAVAVDQSKADGFSNYFDTGNEYTDDVFENVGTGLRCGNLDYGCAETSMLRDQFLSNTVAGVSMRNFNALDMFIWYSLFQNNAVGVTNSLGAGNFHIYNSIFQDSTVADMWYGNTGVFNVRNNYSIGSNYFWYGGGTSSVNNVTLEGNTILDTTSLANAGIGGNPMYGDRGSVFQQDHGPLIFIDNVVRSLSDTVGAAVSGNNIFSMGNTFTISSPLDNLNSTNFHSIGDQIVDRSTVNPTMPTLPPTPPNLARTIYEAAPTGVSTNPCSFASPCDPQTAITKAAVGCSNNVAHIEPGIYSISTMVTVPANCPVQIIGDGSYSQLAAAGGLSTNPVLRLVGPSKATLSNFFINAGGVAGANGLEVTDADQLGSHVFMDQALLGGSTTNLFVDGLDYTNVELHDFYHVTALTSSVNVVGGSLAAAGNWQGGVTNIFAGASTGNYVSYGVSNGAHATVRDIWNDAGAGPTAIANVTGIGTFTYTGSMLALPSGSPLAISLNNFQGTAALVDLNAGANIDITGNGSGAQVLGLGLVGTTSWGWHGTSSGTTAFSDSVADDFIPAMVGNSLVISSGACAAGTYTIASVIDAAHVTLNTSPGTCTDATWASASAAFFSDTSSPADTTEFLNGQTTAILPSSDVPEQGCCDTAFLTATLNQLRTTQPALPVLLPSGVTDVSFYRVYVSSATTGIHLEH